MPRLGAGYSSKPVLVKAGTRRATVTPHSGGHFGGKNDAPSVTAAAAQGTCDQRERVLGLLAETYQEMPVGVTTQGSLVEVLSNDTGKTWAIVVTSPQGISCLLLTGEGWKKLQQVAQDPEA